MPFDHSTPTASRAIVEVSWFDLGVVFGLIRLAVGIGLGHMTVDTCGKRYLPTLHMAFKAHRMSAEVPRSSKESCCPNMAIRLGEFLDGRR